MKETYNITTMLDIGCGPGGMVNLAREMGIQAVGIDGDYTVKRDGDYFVIHDYTVGDSPYNKSVDFAWSCEFVEHVEEKYIPNYIKDFQKAKYVIMTFSESQGHHHVNVKNQEYWVDVFESYGFKFDNETTKIIRSKSTMNTTGKFANNFKKHFVKNTGLFFINEKQ